MFLDTKAHGRADVSKLSVTLQGISVGFHPGWESNLKLPT